jgi:hypothetical protein
MAKSSRLSPLAVFLVTLLVATWCPEGRCLGAAQANSAPPKLTYTKSLKGSVPEYTRISVEASGVGTYEGRKLDDPPNPVPIRLSPGVTARLFDLARELGYFRSLDLEYHKKVANLGQKVFTYQQGGEVFRTEFNYTLNRRAQELTNLFDGISSVEEHIAALQYSMKYDPLGLPGELRQIQMDLAGGQLVDPGLMTPLLENIARNSRFMHLAQVRAQDILQQVQPSN